MFGCAEGCPQCPLSAGPTAGSVCLFGPCTFACVRRPRALQVPAFSSGLRVTALLAAAWGGHAEVVARLLGAGARQDLLARRSPVCRLQPDTVTHPCHDVPFASTAPCPLINLKLSLMMLAKTSLVLVHEFGACGATNSRGTYHTQESKLGTSTLMSRHGVESLCLCQSVCVLCRLG